MDPVEIRPTRPRALVSVLVSAAFGILSLFVGLTQEGDLQLAGYVGAIFFGVIGGTSAYRNLRGAATLTLTADGIRVGEGGHIPWSNFADVGPTNMPGYYTMQPALGLKLRSPDKFTATLEGRPSSLQNRERSGGWDILLPATSLPAPPPVVAERIRAYRAAALGK